MGKYDTCREDFDNDVRCGSPVEFGLNLTMDGLLSNSGIQYGYGSFDTFM